MPNRRPLFLLICTALLSVGLFGCEDSDKVSNGSSGYGSSGGYSYTGEGSSGYDGDSSEGMESGEPNDVIPGAVAGDFQLIKPGRNRKDRHKNFITVARAAHRMGDPHGVVVAAQWALESDWGGSMSGKNNLFGVKVPPKLRGKGLGSLRMTKEQTSTGKEFWEQAEFYDYPNILASVKGRIDFLKQNPRYRKAGYFDAKTPAEAARALKKARYATDVIYDVSLINTIAGVRHPVSGKRLNPHSPIPIASFTSGDSLDDSTGADGSGCDAREIC